MLDLWQKVDIREVSWISADSRTPSIRCPLPTNTDQIWSIDPTDNQWISMISIFIDPFFKSIPVQNFVVLNGSVAQNLEILEKMASI